MEFYSKLCYFWKYSIKRTFIDFWSRYSIICYQQIFCRSERNWYLHWIDTTEIGGMWNIFDIQIFSVFVSEEGVECVVENKEKLLRCVQRSVPEMFSSYHRRRNPNKMHFYVFQQENCRWVIQGVSLLSASAGIIS